MPTKCTQVYWHELPEPQLPWGSATEPEQWKLWSERISVQADQLAWCRSHGMQTVPTLPRTTTQQRQHARHERAVTVKRVEVPSIHRNVVPEPNATPLLVINLIMAHLRQPSVSVEEAEAVVEQVTLHYETLTGLSQRQTPNQPPKAATSSNVSAQPSRQRRETAPLTKPTDSVLSQLQQEDGQSTGPVLTARGGTGVSADSQDCLLLDVMAELCAARGLVFLRQTREEQRASKYRVTSADAVPHRRVVVLADRRDPVFAVLFGGLRRITPEPFVATALDLQGRTAESLKRYRGSGKAYTQVFCMAPSPVPWRRITHAVSLSTFCNDFAVAVIEVATPSNEQDAEEVSEVETAAPKRQRRQESHILGQDTEDDNSAEEVCNTDLDADVPIERRWLRNAPLFPDAVHLSRCETNLGSGGREVRDPLLRLPRSEWMNWQRIRRHKVWYRRLLALQTSDLMALLHNSQIDEGYDS